MPPIRAKKYRLPDTAYRGQKNVAITTNADAPLFKDVAVVHAMLPMLQEHTEAFGCLVGIYCFMPDHLHLVLCGRTEGSDAKAAMDAFKRKSGLWLHEHRPEFAWQGDYYDHIIRKGDDWRRQVRCAHMNPVRRGLVTDPSLWPHTGSIVFDLLELIIDTDY